MKIFETVTSWLKRKSFVQVFSPVVLSDLEINTYRARYYLVDVVTWSRCFGNDLSDVTVAGVDPRSELEWS